MKTYKTRKDQRIIPPDSNHLRHEEADVDVYFSESKDRYKYKIFKGKSSKPLKMGSVQNLETLENIIQDIVKQSLSDIEYKRKAKEAKKTTIKNLKTRLVHGATVRTSYNYSMTFNKFYKVLSNEGNTYTFEILETEWIDGDKGWQGNVKAGMGTGDIIQGKLTSRGLKIDGLYGNTIDSDETFYESHLD